MNLIANRRVLQREIGIGDASHKLLGRRRRSERGWIIMRQPPCRARAGREIWAAEYKSAAGCEQGVWREVLAVAGLAKGRRPSGPVSCETSEGDFLIQNPEVSGRLTASSSGKNSGFTKWGGAGSIEYCEFEACWGADLDPISCGQEVGFGEG